MAQIVKNAAVTLLALWGLGMVFAHAADPLDAREIINKIRESENKIRTMQCQYEVYIPDQKCNLFAGQWLYDLGREKLDGKHGFSADHDSPVAYFPYIISFDGLKNWEWNGFPSHHHYRSVGSISYRAYGLYDDMLTPRCLLGQTFGNWSRGSTPLHQTLVNAASIKVHSESPEIDGHHCILIEALLFGLSENLNVANVKEKYDLLIWLDPERDYRPLKIVQRQHMNSGQSQELPLFTIDKIKLQKIADIWFPIAGEVDHYSLRHVPKPGVTKDQLEHIQSEEEARELTMMVSKSMDGVRQVSIDPQTIRLNEKIPIEKFYIHFPKDCYFQNNIQHKEYLIPSDSISYTDPMFSADELPSDPTKSEN